MNLVKENKKHLDFHLLPKTKLFSLGLDQLQLHIKLIMSLTLHTRNMSPQ